MRSSRPSSCSKPDRSRRRSRSATRPARPRTRSRRCCAPTTSPPAVSSRRASSRRETVLASDPRMQAESDARSSATLLWRVASGDPQAIRDCLAQYGGLVWSIARRFEPDDAEDAVQEIFLDLWKSAARFDPAVASEATFIAMITRRRLIDRRRTRRRRPTTEQVPVLPAVPDEGIRPDASVEASKAARALDQLRPEQRQVLVLSTCHGLSHGEIAAETGMPLGTVKAHARRGLMSIRAALLGVQEEQP